jgi:superfamily II DNA helicase RecQ
VALEHQALFNALKKWRNDCARRDGKPAYVLFTNAQLAHMAQQRPTTSSMGRR